MRVKNSPGVMLVAVNLGLVRGPGGVDVADIVSCPRGVRSRLAPLERLRISAMVARFGSALKYCFGAGALQWREMR